MIDKSGGLHDGESLQPISGLGQATKENRGGMMRLPASNLDRKDSGQDAEKRLNPFIAIPSGGGATRQLKCLLSVPFKSEQ